MSKSPQPPMPQAQPRPQPQPPERKPKPPKTASGPWGPFRRIAISVLVSAHLLAVFVAPWALGLRTQELFYLPPRDFQGRTIPVEQRRADQIHFVIPVMAEALYRVCSHYNDLLYINSGYEYFTPDPVWSHLLRYEVFDAAGQKIAEGQMPDRRDQWPRLFYHRHMMLIDQTIDMPNSDYYVATRLLDRYNGERVHMQLIRHHLLTPKEVMDGKRLDDPSTYEVIGELDQVRGRPKPPPLPRPRPEGAPDEIITLPEAGP